jgi:hypothetical protein
MFNFSITPSLYFFFSSLFLFSSHRDAPHWLGVKEASWGAPFGPDRSVILSLLKLFCSLSFLAHLLSLVTILWFISHTMMLKNIVHIMVRLFIR